VTQSAAPRPSAQPPACPSTPNGTAAFTIGCVIAALFLLPSVSLNDLAQSAGGIERMSSPAVLLLVIAAMFSSLFFAIARSAEGGYRRMVQAQGHPLARASSVETLSNGALVIDGVVVSAIAHLLALFLLFQ
jgi:hypothetical protein